MAKAYLAFVQLKGYKSSFFSLLLLWKCYSDRDHMVVGFTTTLAISAYHH
jgi:hypothetical protein